MYRLPKDQQNKLFSTIAASEKLYLPTDKNDGGAHFTEWTEGAVLSEKLNTVRSAKDFFFPQTENLADFKVSGKTIEVIDTRSETEDFVIFGVRACDAASFGILDRVFLADPVDSYYKNRREHATIMTMACGAPEETCFCTAFGIDPTAPGGDVSCWADKDYFYFDAKTEKGKALVGKIASLLQKCNDDGVEKLCKQTKKIMNELPLSDLRPDDFTQKQLDVFRSPEWASLSESCLGCGTCTFICPTCQCYDIKEFNTGNGEIKRFRCWDSCMYSDFTLMAAGNPRHSQLERFRQRFMHKLVYFPINNDGVYGCVGCGRCLRKCPISMNIVKVMKAIGGENRDK